jgi:hypothetical protein
MGAGSIKVMRIHSDEIMNRNYGVKIKELPASTHSIVHSY